MASREWPLRMLCCIFWEVEGGASGYARGSLLGFFSHVARRKLVLPGPLQYSSPADPTRSAPASPASYVRNSPCSSDRLVSPRALVLESADGGRLSMTRWGDWRVPRIDRRLSGWRWRFAPGLGVVTREPEMAGEAGCLSCDVPWPPFTRSLHVCRIYPALKSTKALECVRSFGPRPPS